MGESGSRLVAWRLVFEIVLAAIGFVMGLLFAFQLDLGNVPGFFMGLMGAIFAFILGQGFTDWVFRILRK